MPEQNHATDSRQLQLVQLYPYPGPAFPLPDGAVILGAERTCDIVLGPQAGSLQLVLTPSSTGCLLRLPGGGSRVAEEDGARINGRPATHATPLQPGDVLRLGQVVLCLARRPATEAASQPAAGSLLPGGSSLDDVRAQLQQLAPTDRRVVLLGEVGTDRELVARELHRLSGRRGPCIAVGCHQLPAGTVEAELFGDGQGAHEPTGLLGAARQGTLLLNRITELPALAQGRLAGLLARWGEREEVAPARCRVLCSAEQPLGEVAAQGRFDARLAALLTQATVRLPPLRQRTNELPALILALSQRLGRPLQLDADVTESLCTYHWPLNLRELDQVVRRLVQAAPATGAVDRGRLPPELSGQLPTPQPTVRRRARSNSRVLQALRRNHGNIRLTSRELGVSRSYIYRCLDRSGVDPSALREAEGRVSASDGSDAS